MNRYEIEKALLYLLQRQAIEDDNCLMIGLNSDNVILQSDGLVLLGRGGWGAPFPRTLILLINNQSVA